MRLVWKNRIFARNFINDFISKMKNILGGRLKIYEKMLNTAIKETNDEFFRDYPNASNIRVDTESVEGNAVMVTITGELDE